MSTPLSLSRAHGDATGPSTPDAAAEALHEALAGQHAQLVTLQATVDDLRGQPAAEATGRDVAERALRTAIRTIGEIEAALQRVELGTFGRCERCGEAIAPARLELVPYASQCVACPADPEVGR